MFGYIYLQDGQAIEPAELRGLLIRIRNVAIGDYDPTFLDYPNIEGPRFNWLSSEIYVESGLEHALNIDRDSFNELHPHYVSLQQMIHEALRDVFMQANRGTKQRAASRDRDAQKNRIKAIRRLVTRADHRYIVEEVDQGEYPATIDTRRKRLILSKTGGRFFRTRSKPKLATIQTAAAAFEIAMLAPEAERRDTFYSALGQLLEPDADESDPAQ